MDDGCSHDLNPYAGGVIHAVGNVPAMLPELVVNGPIPWPYDFPIPDWMRREP